MSSDRQKKQLADEQRLAEQVKKVQEKIKKGSVQMPIHKAKFAIGDWVISIQGYGTMAIGTVREVKVDANGLHKYLIDKHEAGLTNPVKDLTEYDEEWLKGMV